MSSSVLDVSSPLDVVEEGSFWPLVSEGTLLNLALDPFEGSLDTVLTLLQNSVTGRGSPSESSCEIDGR